MSRLFADNSIIKDYAKINGVKIYELAHAYGYSDTGSFYKRLHYEFSKDEKQYLVSLVDKIAKGEDINELHVAGKNRIIQEKMKRVDAWLAKQGRDVVRKMDRFSADDEDDYHRATEQVIKSLSEQIRESMEG